MAKKKLSFTQIKSTQSQRLKLYSGLDKDYLIKFNFIWETPIRLFKQKEKEFYEWELMNARFLQKKGKNKANNLQYILIMIFYRFLKQIKKETPLEIVQFINFWNLSVYNWNWMKILAFIGALACGTLALKSEHEDHQLKTFEHELFWCCDRKGG